MPVLKDEMFLLNFINPNSRPHGPNDSILPLSSTLVVCPPNLKTKLVMYLL